MPTIKLIGPYRFFFYAGDRTEPPHIHVERERNVAKFWLNPVRLQSSGRFRAHEIGKIQRLVETHEREFMEAWDAYFSD
ncbi:MAG: DUF4160 domain-containing protein [Chloroflexi bacterium]|nr:DUF4160 domain-containing protein [Chloroflexota bacterium]